MVGDEPSLSAPTGPRAAPNIDLGLMWTASSTDFGTLAALLQRLYVLLLPLGTDEDPLVAAAALAALLAGVEVPLLAAASVHCTAHPLGTLHGEVGQGGSVEGGWGVRAVRAGESVPDASRADGAAREEAQQGRGQQHSLTGAPPWHDGIALSAPKAHFTPESVSQLLALLFPFGERAPARAGGVLLMRRAHEPSPEPPFEPTPALADSGGAEGGPGAGGLGAEGGAGGRGSAHVAAVLVTASMGSQMFGGLARSTGISAPMLAPLYPPPPCPATPTPSSQPALDPARVPAHGPHSTMQTAWQLAQDGARHLICERLRSHAGGPAQTLATLERLLYGLLVSLQSVPVELPPPGVPPPPNCPEPHAAHADAPARSAMQLAQQRQGGWLAVEFAGGSDSI